MGTWNKTDFKGVRYRAHPTRKHGVQADRYYVLTYKLGGKTKTEAVGWASEGVKPSDCYDTLSQFKRNQKSGQGPRTLAEMREQGKMSREAEARKASEDARRNISFKRFFDETYFPDAEITKKPETARKEREHVKNWIHPVTRDVPLRELALPHIKKIRANLVRAGRSPRTQQYVFRTFSTVWNSARDAGLVQGQCPTKNRSFRLEKINNERERFLTPDEADRLLEAVGKRSVQAHDMSLVALYCGLRFGEVASLVWDRIDLENSLIRILNGKGDKSRSVPMTARVRALFKAMDRGRDNELVFPGRNGQMIQQVPSSFKRAVEDISLNKDISDPKKRFSFHGLRHTCASWMVQAGVDLYRVQRHLGHSTPVTTTRYGHLEAKDLKAAVQSMESRLEALKTNGKVVPLRRKERAE